MREIGSEFWDTSLKTSQEKYLLSGRTALDYIIRDIKNSDKINSVLIPSWCCHTMIEPFVRHKIPVRFYDVFWDFETGLSVQIPKPLKNEIFYYMSYFGFDYLYGIDYKYIREKWEYIIADETHSWLGNKQYANCSSMPDYRYISYRKWTGIYGISSAIKQYGHFNVESKKNDATNYCLLRQEASNIKASYMNGTEVDKVSFLEKYNMAEELLEADYADYVPSLEAIEQLINIDEQYVKQRRRCNARYLIDMLAKIKEVDLLFNELGENDVPLFVPILVKENDRDELRKFLINRNVYCPVHWPISDFHKTISDKATKIYRQELSMLCDQRYNMEDMRTIVETICLYYTGRKK